MKKYILISIIATAAIIMNCQPADATIWRVNNNPGKSCDFTNITDAFRALNSGKTMPKNGDEVKMKKGDTIHIEGSNTTYGKLPTVWNAAPLLAVDSILVKCVIIGPGYLLGDNDDTQHNTDPATVRTIYIGPKAAGTVIAGLSQEPPPNVGNATTAGGAYSVGYYPTGIGASVKTGGAAFALNPIYKNFTQWNAMAPNTNGTTSPQNWGANALCYKLRIHADSVTVSHCKLFYVDLFNVESAIDGAAKDLSHITITKCFFNPGVIAASAGKGKVKNLIISNNFFRNDWYYSYLYGSYPIAAVMSNMVICLKTWADMASSSTGQLAYATLNATNYQAVNNSDTSDPGAALGVNTLFFWTAERPIIQNNTFYYLFNISAKGVNLFNNLFFPCTSATQLLGLPQDVRTPHTTSNNIIYSGYAWGSQSVDMGYAGNYGGMMNNVDGNVYNNQPASTATPEGTWFTAANSYELDKTFKLGGSSPAKADTDMKQRGMFGGLSPYVLSGLYTIPAVYSISIPSYPSGEVPSTGFEVRVKVMSH